MYIYVVPAAFLIFFAGVALHELRLLISDGCERHPTDHADDESERRRLDAAQRLFPLSSRGTESASLVASQEHLSMHRLVEHP